MNQCDCAKDGYCPRYKRQMAGRLRQICQGEVLDPATCQQYRDLWASQANEAAPDRILPGAPPKPFHCPHLKRRARNLDGSVKKRKCDFG